MDRRTQATLGYVLRGILVLATPAALIGVCEAALTRSALRPAPLLNALLFVPGWFLALIAHESAHAWVGRALGLYVWRVRIGSGLPLFRRQILGFQVHVHAIPLSGATLLCPRDDRPWRWRMWLAVAAGPLASALLLAGGLWAAGWRDAGIGSILLHARVNPLGAFVVANAVALAAALFPFGMREPGSLLQSDGQRLLSLPFSPEMPDQLRGARFMLEAEEARERGELDAALRRCEEGLRLVPGSTVLRHQQAVVLLQQGDMARARSILVEIRDAAHVAGQLRASYENDIAWANVFLEDPALHNEALRYAKANVKALRGAGWAHRTYGAVLVRRGRLEAAVSELLLAWRLSAGDQARAHNAAWLAAAEAGRGRLSDAKRWLEAAKALDPNSYSLSVAVRAITEAEERTAPPGESELVSG